MVNTNCIFLVKTYHFYKEMLIFEFVTMLGMKGFGRGNGVLVRQSAHFGFAHVCINVWRFRTQA